MWQVEAKQLKIWIVCCEERRLVYHLILNCSIVAASGIVCRVSNFPPDFTSTISTTDRSTDLQSRQYSIICECYCQPPWFWLISEIRNSQDLRLLDCMASKFCRSSRMVMPTFMRTNPEIVGPTVSFTNSDESETISICQWADGYYEKYLRKEAILVVGRQASDVCTLFKLLYLTTGRIFDKPG